MLETDAEAVTVKPREQLGEFNVWPLLKTIRYSGTWMHAKDFDDMWPKNRIRWQLWTLRFEIGCAANGIQTRGTDPVWAS